AGRAGRGPRAPVRRRRRRGATERSISGASFARPAARPLLLLAAALVRHAGRGRGPGAEAGEGAVRADPVAGRARSPVERAVLRDAPPRQRARAVRWPAGAVRSAAGAASAGGGLASEGCPIAAPARNRSEAGSTAETALPALRVLRRAGPPRAGAVRIRSATW